jgi:hypothetical protein
MNNTTKKLSSLLGSQPRGHRLALEEQPFDRFLCAKSHLFCRSRALYIDQGGRYRATLVSSPRTLSSSILLEDLIEYTPIERELQWSLTDPIESRSSNHFRSIRPYVVATFHEQNHRLLWRLLPPAPGEARALRRYLSFAEALVVATDMALGDELGPAVAPALYESGAIYDPGTKFGTRLSKQHRAYRNYLQAVVFATYLNMELYDPDRIAGATETMFATVPTAGRAAKRALLLGRDFVEKTAPFWEKKNRAEVAKRLGGKNPLLLPADPRENHLQYLWAERWFEKIGI